jgi:hypothetical protein
MRVSPLVQKCGFPAPRPVECGKKESPAVRAREACKHSALRPAGWLREGRLGLAGSSLPAVSAPCYGQQPVAIHDLFAGTGGLLVVHRMKRGRRSDPYGLAAGNISCFRYPPLSGPGCPGGAGYFVPKVQRNDDALVACLRQVIPSQFRPNAIPSQRRHAVSGGLSRG